MTTVPRNEQAESLRELSLAFWRVQEFGRYNPVFLHLGEGTWSRVRAEAATEIEGLCSDLELLLADAKQKLLRSGYPIPDSWLMIHAPEFFFHEDTGDCEGTPTLDIEIRRSFNPSEVSTAIREIQAALTRWEVLGSQPEEGAASKHSNQRKKPGRPKGTRGDNFRSVVQDLKAGMKPADVAKRHDLTDGRITQIRDEEIQRMDAEGKAATDIASVFDLGENVVKKIINRGKKV